MAEPELETGRAEQIALSLLDRFPSVPDDHPLKERYDEAKAEYSRAVLAWEDDPVRGRAALDDFFQKMIRATVVRGFIDDVAMHLERGVDSDLAVAAAIAHCRTEIDERVPAVLKDDIIDYANDMVEEYFEAEA